MKGPPDRTKVVLRHLPPTISESNLAEQIDSRFSGRYHWLAFRPGKSNSKRLTYSRAYIDFNKSEDVIEFAEFFNGHVFVNEKGTQFKTMVEYAPSQRAPKQLSKDGREGTILKDPGYLEFLELLAKPVENLPSAEIQLERKAAERAGAPKDDPIVTPLMDYVRQKRAAKGEARRTVNGKSTKKASGTTSRTPLSSSSKRGSEKRKAAATMYVLKETSKIVNSTDNSTYLLVNKQEDEQPKSKSVNSAAVSGNEAFEAEAGGPGSTGSVKKKVLLLKGKEKEIFSIPGNLSTQQNVPSPTRASHSSAPLKQNHRREASGRIIRSILVNARQPSGSQTSNHERDKKPPRSPNLLQSFQRDINSTPADNKAISKNMNATPTDKPERRTRSKDRPDHGVWPPLRWSDESHASDEILLSASQTSEAVDSTVTNLDTKPDMLVNRGARGRHYSAENGSHRHGSRHGLGYNFKDSDGTSVAEGKLLRRGGSSGYGLHEKQVWVQKSSSGT